MKKYMILTLTALICASCYKKLEVAPPSNITDEQIMRLLTQDPTQVLEPMVGGIFVRMSTGSGLPSSNDVRYNTWSNYGIGQNYKGNDMSRYDISYDFFLNDYRLTDYRGETSASNAQFWELLYRNIYLANQILKLITDDMLQAVEGDVLANLKRYKAAALTYRSHAYIYLMWVYSDDYINGTNKQGVPMYAPDENFVLSIDPAPRSSAETVWNQVISDLEMAITLFDEAGVNPTTSTEDMDQAVACVLLARAAITFGQFDKVISAADKVSTLLGGWPLMNEEQYVGGADKLNGFTSLDRNPEVIWGWIYSKTWHTGVFAGTSFNGWMNIYATGIGGESRRILPAIDDRLYDQIDDNDYRKKNFLDDGISYTYSGLGAEGLTVYIPQYSNQKFGTSLAFDGTSGSSATTTNHLHDYTDMRVSELLLLKAEAEYRSGAEGTARTTLGILTGARGAPAVTEGGDALFQRIQREARIEMWGEGGFEYYNNKRWNIGVDRTTSQSHTVRDVVVAPGVAFTWQIPETEMNYNPHMTGNQNP